MLSAKPWKADAIIRLTLSVIVCVFAGSLLVSAQHYVSAGGKESARLFYPLTALALGCLAVTLVLLSKPWPLENLPRRLLILMVCAYGGLFLGAWVQKASGVAGADSSIWQVVAASLSFQGVGLILIARFLHEHHVGWSEAFGFANRRGRALLLGVLAALLFLPLGRGLQEASALVMTHLPFFEMEPQEQLPVRVLRASMSWPGRITLGATAMLLAPLAEEILFRGILYTAVKQAGFPRLALWGSVLLFAVVHMNAVTFLPLAVLALFLTALYERTDNLLAPITAHAVFNTVELVRLFLMEHGYAV
jgi:membrane protease YdiL (CAAX protease family)